jgi:uronate dehydrogenase
MTVSLPGRGGRTRATSEAPGYAPPVRDFAVTYPQLVRQAIAAGLDERDLRELRAVYDVALRQFDGLYRAGGQPFICHMVRTASILLAEGQPLPLVEAALVHATYDAHRYEHSTRAWPGRRLRRRMRREVGSDVEGIVWAFHEVPWERIGAPEIQLRELPHASAIVRSALALRVANDLENHMDLALIYRTGRQFKDRIESDGSAIVQVARGLGMTTLADELSMVFRESLEETLPATVRWDRSRGYELPARTTSRTSSVTRFASRARRALGRRLRRRLGKLAVGRSRTTRQREGTRSMPGEAISRAQSRPRILVTGAAGQVGREVVPYLREHFSLRLLDVQRMPRLGDDDVVRADVRDADALRRACRDVSAIVHLAVVDHQEPDFTTRMMPVNVDGTYQVFEAARCAGVGRVVLASTGQVVGAYPATEWLTTDAPVRPSSVYACTKVFGEALARYYADCHGVAAICLRIGWFDAYDGHFLRHRPEMQRAWCSPRDLAQLIRKSIQSDVRFAVLFGVSDNPRRRLDLEDARTTVGYIPQDRAPDRLVGDAT